MFQDSFSHFFHNKTVTLLGLGLLGRGVGDAAFLAQYCKHVLVTDMKSAEELKPSLDALKDFKNIDYFLGGHPDQIFTDTDFVIKGAGVRLDHPQIALARKNNIPIYMSTVLFAQLSKIKTIGVTGTRGKTTVTMMIAEILKQAGKKVLLGGNIRGVSTLAMLPHAQNYDVAVLELDSWQLQGFDSLEISPNISVFTNFYPDHMNYYDGDMARYLRDKTAIFRHHQPGDVLVTTGEMLELLKQETQMGLRITAHLQEQKRGFRNDEAGEALIVAPSLPPAFKLQIPGAHNLANAALARQAALSYGIPENIIDTALQTFTGVEGRLQKVGTWQGRVFYNDSNSTTQEATMAALTAFPPENIVLIFGGNDKGLPIDVMLGYLSSHDIRCVLIKGTGSDRVLKHLPQIPVVSSMPDAVAKAVEMSEAGDNIVLSPAFTSFGVFKNEYDRSDQFMANVQELISKTE